MKKEQTLANVDNKHLHYQTVYELCIEYFCSSCKFEIPVRAAVSKIYLQTVTTN